MFRSTPALRHVVVVDAKPGDYAEILSAEARPGVVFNFAVSAEDALRIGFVPRATWLVNIRLPDMPGHELAALVLDRTDGAVFLVADQYDPADEIAALQHPRTLYGCKPPHQSWLTLLTSGEERFPATRPLLSGYAPLAQSKGA